MLSEHRGEFTKENLDGYLKDLAKEYRKQAGKSMPAEITIIGGAAVLINYGFREATTDIDALIHAASAMKDAIRTVSDKYDLPKDWLNSDFLRTESYTQKLDQYSTYYKTFSNVLTIRTISSEYLIAMKLRSGRQYKNDLSDVLGILAEHEKRGEAITMEQIRRAVEELYGSWDSIPEHSREYIRDIMRGGRFSEKYDVIRKNEQQTRQTLIRFEKGYPGVANNENVKDIADGLQKEKSAREILEDLKKQNK